MKYYITKPRRDLIRFNKKIESALSIDIIKGRFPQKTVYIFIFCNGLHGILLHVLENNF